MRPSGFSRSPLPLVARLGLSAVSALATYVVVVSVAAALFIALRALSGGGVGRGISLREFARAAAPAQAVAAASRSSLAALPALIDSARTRLHLPEEITSFFLPLATALFRVGATLGLTTGSLFIARLYGVSISGPQLVTIVATAIVTSFSIPGIPGGSIIAMAPVLASVGLPIEGLGILLGVDTIPDMFRTTANVTGQLAAAVIVSRRAAAPSRADPDARTLMSTPGRFSGRCRGSCCRLPRCFGRATTRVARRRFRDIERPRPPFVSAIIPARNERRNIERCVRSVLSAHYPSFEVIVVNDHSTDGTDDVRAQRRAADARLRVVDAPDLPAGWFGKQWACTTGARAARGELLVFTDADTRHEPDLLPRAVNAMRARRRSLHGRRPSRRRTASGNGSSNRKYSRCLRSAMAAPSM